MNHYYVSILREVNHSGRYPLSMEGLTAREIVENGEMVTTHVEGGAMCAYLTQGLRPKALVLGYGLFHVAEDPPE